MKRKSIYRILSLVLILSLASLFSPAISFAAAGNTASEAELRSKASKDGEGDIILSVDIGELASQLTIARSLTLDLNGHTLSIILAGSPGNSSSGVKIESGVTLTIKDSVGYGILNVVNKATSASTGCAAAINVTDGTLIVKSGTITATGGSYGAGIGGGHLNAGGIITIDGGSVTAQGGSYAAGIGGGYTGTGGRITINGGVVTAQGGIRGAGIGGGGNASGSIININGGIVNAVGGGDYYGGAGIGGGGYGGAGGTISISSGTITAKGGGSTMGGAGIGGGSSGGAGTISISNGTITATGGGAQNYGGSGIGCGYSGQGGTISINDGIIIAKSNAANPAIGGAGTFVIIKGGKIIASTSGKGWGAIYGSTINITGKYDYWVNTENSEPDEKTGSGDFTDANPFPFSNTYLYIKLVPLPGPTPTPTPTSTPTPPPTPTPSPDSTQCDVLAKITGESKPEINVDIQWGKMKFVFDVGGRTWDPKTHKYIDGTGEASWLVNNAHTNDGNATEWYLENGNNRIVVTNHSNTDINVFFNYTMLTGAEFDGARAGDATPFNARGGGQDNVVGGFYASEGGAKSGALILKNPRTATGYNTLPDGKIILPTAEGRSLDSADLTGSVYFAFSGTPDAGRREVLPEFKKVGAITVTFSQFIYKIINEPNT